MAEPELRTAIDALQLQPGMRLLDAGCGTGETLGWLAAAAAPAGLAVGVDLSRHHLQAARTHLASEAHLLQADLLKMPLRPASFDLVWSVNTVHHLCDPAAAVRALSALLGPRGRLALGQSSFLPDMYFAWDARLERLTNEAVRAYYRERYHLDEEQLTGVRALMGLLHAAGFAHVAVRTFVIERVAPPDPATRAWLLEAIFRDTWGERLRPYLAAADFEQVRLICDPQHPRFALRRADFHFVQTFTLAVAERSAQPPILA